MKIIETMLCGKFDQQRCEDSLFVSDDFVAVIDGVSSKTDFRFEGKTTGKLASEFVVETLKTFVPFPVSWTVKMKKKQKETQDILSYHTQAAGCSDKARAKASGGRQPIEECGRTGL